MLPYSELEYGGFRDTVTALLERFQLREAPEAAPSAEVAGAADPE